MSIIYGKTIIVEDVFESIDSSIDQVVSKAIFKENGSDKLYFGDRAIDYNQNFKLYLTSKMANPHYLPEVFIKTLIINFTVTFDGLDEQLLADVVISLDPEVEK
jgi:dynein heavy chain